MILANNQVTFPMPRNGSIIGLCGSFINKRHISKPAARFLVFLCSLSTLLSKFLKGELLKLPLHIKVEVVVDSLFAHSNYCINFGTLLQEIRNLKW
jgi:hypothetical protein